MRKAIVVGGALLAAALGASAADARACGFLNYRPRLGVETKAVAKAPARIIPASELVATADQKMEEERLTDAAKLVVQAFPKLKTDRLEASPLELHAKRILALAIVRASPPTATVTERSGVAAAARNSNSNTNVAWAVDTLREIRDLRGEDPVAQADLGEALAADAAREFEATTILEDLASRDLIGSAHAYAALARLRAKSGDASKTQALLARCQVMTRAPDLVCRAVEPQVAIR